MRKTRRDRRDVAEIAIGELGAGGPIPSAAAEGRNLCNPRLATEVECAEIDVGIPRIPHPPVLVTKIEGNAITPFRVAMQRSADGSVHAALIDVPTIKAGDVRPRTVEVVILRRDGFDDLAAKRVEQGRPFVRAETVEFFRLQDGVELAVIASVEAEVESGIDAESAET